jgi:hypothetical protein
VPEVKEDLLREAREVHALAARHCAAPGQPGCGWYHASLPTLRLLGVFDSPGSDDDFLLPAMRAEFGRGATRVLVSGCADAAMLARVAACLPPSPAAIEIVVLDRCRTPLRLCDAYAVEHALAIRTVRSDILEYEDAPFDLVCTHSFLSFFDTAGRNELARVWWRLCASGAAVLTAQRVRAGYANPARVGYGAAEAAALSDDAGRRAAGREAETGISESEARRLAGDWTRNYFAHVIASEVELRTPFEAAGFRLEQCAASPLPPGSDRPGTPRGNAGSRWRIIARRPAETSA